MLTRARLGRALIRADLDRAPVERARHLAPVVGELPLVHALRRPIVFGMAGLDALPLGLEHVAQPLHLRLCGLVRLLRDEGRLVGGLGAASRRLELHHRREHATGPV